MDWYLDPDSPEAAHQLRHEFAAYLRRHADPDNGLDSAELIFAETIANAIEHGEGAVWVSVEWSQTSPTLVVHDLGAGFHLAAGLPPDDLAEGGRGLFLVSHLADELAVAAKQAGGSRVTVTLPVRRSDDMSHEPPRRRLDALPTSSEAAADGTFGKESFLRALVVHLAQAVEFQHGPAQAAAAVSEVGTNVGGRMEDEYRHARDIVGNLSPEQIGDLYVRLKGAIDGDFYVIEATDSKIVLGNRACPFGEVVKRAPTLCRMTSSVFGGIAARNAGGAVVRLEERIAVGDPECRVTVWLGADAEGRAGHRYRAPGEIDRVGQDA